MLASLFCELLSIYQHVEHTHGHTDKHTHTHARATYTPETHRSFSDNSIVKKSQPGYSLEKVYFNAVVSFVF